MSPALPTRKGWVRSAVRVIVEERRHLSQSHGVLHANGREWLCRQSGVREAMYDFRKPVDAAAKLGVIRQAVLARLHCGGRKIRHE